MSAPARRRGFSVRVFLPDGDPDGIKVVEKSNWTGSGLVVPRALFAEARKREEFDRTGVYVLVGQAEGSPLPQVYVGEGDPVKPRLEQHAKQKDFWTHAVIFTSKDQSLNKAHVQHLESRLVGLATASKRCVLDNSNSPQPPSLTEADTAETEGFLDGVLLCLPVLGHGFFEPAPAATSAATPLLLKGKGIKAHGFESAKGFVVRAGSQAVKEEVASMHKWAAHLVNLRAELVRQGVFVDKGSVYAMTQDYAFSSPSMASGTLLGRNSNGFVDWKTEDGRTLKEIRGEAAAA